MQQYLALQVGLQSNKLLVSAFVGYAFTDNGCLFLRPIINFKVTAKSQKRKVRSALYPGIVNI